ncbi:g2678 [Coccomyxa elongata]
MECVGAIDQGTQSTRFLIYDRTARLIASHQVEFTQITPRPGWVEHDPLEVWQSVLVCLEKAVKAAKTKEGDIKIVAVGITNQRETTLVWDRTTGKPLHNAIVWMDRRTAGICQRFAEDFGSKDHYRAKTGLPVSTYFSAFKWTWLHENVAAVREAKAAGRCMLGTIDSWLIYNLTGGVSGGIHVTDVSNAARTFLMDIHTLAWDADLLQRFGLSLDMLPRICSNAEVYGAVKGTPLDGVPIAGCLGDQQAAMLGQRCKPLEAKNTYGTGCFVLLNTGDTPIQSSHGLLTTMAYKLGPSEPAHYALEGSIAIAGAGVSWLKDNLRIIDSPEESATLAASIDGTGGVYFVPAFGGLLAPQWRDDARGVILGISSFTTRAHIARALLEAIAWQTKEVLDAMVQDAGREGFSLLRVDGGASRNDVLMQLQADAIQIPVRRPEHLETTCLGAAFAAGIGSGFWTKEWVLHSDACHAQDSQEFRPQADPEEIQQRFNCWQEAVKRSFNLEHFELH